MKEVFFPLSIPSSILVRSTLDEKGNPVGHGRLDQLIRELERTGCSRKSRDGTLWFFVKLDVTTGDLTFVEKKSLPPVAIHKRTE